jgi:hypothetical protein
MSFPMSFPKEMPPCLEMSVLLFSIDPRLSPKSAIFGKRASIRPVAHYSLVEMARRRSDQIYGRNNGRAPPTTRTLPVLLSKALLNDWTTLRHGCFAASLAPISSKH